MKKLFSILICFLMLATCILTGCATFSINKAKYYNEVLATVGEEKITRFDLLTAYNSYGNSYYVQQMGQSETEALTSTLDLLVDRELMYQYAVDQGDLYKPTKYQVNSIIEEMFSSLDSQFESYIDTTKQILEIEEDEPTAAESSDKTSYSLTNYKYSPRAKVVYKNGEQKIEYISESEPNSFDELIASNLLSSFTEEGIYEEIKNKYFDKFETLLSEKKFSSENNLIENYAQTITNNVKELFAQDLIDYEYYLRNSDGKKYDKSTENLITRYIERTFKDKIQSQYIENMRVNYLENSQLSINDLTSEFAYLLDLDYDKYNKNHEAYGNKMKDIGTDADSVLYHPNTEAKFGYFVHTLINFDNIKENLTLLENETDPDKYEEQYNSLISNNQIMQREYDADTQTYTDSDTMVSLKTVIDEYNAIVNGSYSSTQEKLQAFINFMFKYSTDTGTLSAGMPYVVGTDGYSAMEQAFTDEAIKLMDGNAGNMSQVNLNNIEDMCITSYGIHVLFYVGEVNINDIPYQDKDASYIAETDVEGAEGFNLYTKKLNPLTEQTYFDMLFDYIYPASSGEVYTSNNGYTAFEEEVIAQSSKTHKVVRFETKINGTKTSI